MIKIGEYQKLKVYKEVDFGVYLGDESEQVLLPKKQVPKGLEKGGIIDVFVYRDSSDRPIATVHKPFLTLGEVAKLTVSQVTNIGAFLDWGLEKDLLLPFKEQTIKVRVGEEYPVALYTDKSGRLCATMKIYEYLLTESLYAAEDTVKGTVYEINPEFGVFVAVDDKYHGLIQNKEVIKDYKPGDSVNARVIKVRPDGKLDLSVRAKAYENIEKNAGLIYEKISGEYNGMLPYTDKADAQLIKKDFEMSKNDFKKAIGRLLKTKRVVIGENSIKLTDKYN